MEMLEHQYCLASAEGNTSGVTQQRLAVGHVADGSAGSTCSTALGGAPDLSAQRPCRSRAGKSRWRMKLRAFFRGVHCGNGPPGLEKGGSAVLDDNVRCAAIYRMDAGDTDEEEEDGGAGLPTAQVLCAGTRSHFADEGCADDQVVLITVPANGDITTAIKQAADITQADPDAVEQENYAEGVALGNWSVYGNCSRKACWGKGVPVLLSPPKGNLSWA